MQATTILILAFTETNECCLCKGHQKFLIRIRAFKDLALLGKLERNASHHDKMRPSRKANNKKARVHTVFQVKIKSFSKNVNIFSMILRPIVLFNAFKFMLLNTADFIMGICRKRGKFSGYLYSSLWFKPKACLKNFSKFQTLYKKELRH